MALILDTGPLYASLDRSDADYAVCRRLIEEVDESLVIPVPHPPAPPCGRAAAGTRTALACMPAPAAE